MSDAARAIQHQLGFGRICEVGQHGACPGVGDPWDEEAKSSRTVWVCSCACHGSSAVEQTAALEKIEETAFHGDAIKP